MVTPRPTEKRSFGANRTHYPGAGSGVPWLDQAVPNEKIAECNLEDIKAKTNSFTDAQVAAGARVLVKPGVIRQGHGGGSASKVAGKFELPEQERGGYGLGKASWGDNYVLIQPLNGAGTVTFGYLDTPYVVNGKPEGKGYRFDNWNNIALFGFKFATFENQLSDMGLVWTQTYNFHWGWSKVDQFQFTQSGNNIHLWEIVAGFTRLEDNSDVAAWRPTIAGTGTITNVYRHGCIFGPSIKKDGSGAHSDTIQFERASTGTLRYGDFFHYDCMDFASSNALYLLANNNTQFYHCYGVGNDESYVIMPRIANRPGGGNDYDWDGKNEYKPNLFAGGGKNRKMYDSIMVGSPGSGGTWDVVENTKISYAKIQNSQKPLISGAWTVDESITGKTKQEYYTIMGGEPSAARLYKMWDWVDAAPPVDDDTAPTAPTQKTPAVSGTSVSLSWNAASDNVGVTGYRLYRDGIQIADTPDLFFVDTNRSAGTTYVYTVKAYDAAGNISVSAASRSVTIPVTPNPDDTQAPSIPTIKNLTLAGSYVTITWNASTDNVGVAGYRLYRDNVQIGSASNLEYIDTSPVKGNTYVYSVRALDNAGNISDPSPTKSILVPGTGTPGDTEPPTVTLMYPRTDLTKFSNTVTIRVEAEDNVGVQSVEIWSETAKIGDATRFDSSEWRFDFDSTEVKNGLYSISAVAKDYSNSTRSSVVKVIIDNVEKPIIDPTQPIIEDLSTTGLEVDVVQFDEYGNMQVLDIIPRREDLKILEEMQGPGAGSFALSKLDPKLEETPNLLDYRNVIRCKQNGKTISAFVIQKKESKDVSSSEYKGQRWEVSGEGPRTWLNEAIVFPYGPLRSDTLATRVFNFASERGQWYKPQDWITPTVVASYLEPGSQYGTAPAQWPDAPNAKWIWSSPAGPIAKLGFNYFRYEFTSTESKSYSLFFAGDDTTIAYVDGQLASVISERLATWTDTTRVDFTLPAGNHVLGFRVENIWEPDAGLMAALFEYGDPAVPTSAVLKVVTGDPGWLVNPYPATAPGWSAGEIVLNLLSEAKARGVRFPHYLKPTFTAEKDSDGYPWNSPLDWSFDIGTSYADVINRLEELVCEVWVNPDDFTLNLYNVRGVDRSLPGRPTYPQISSQVDLLIGKNLLRAESSGEADIKNALLMQTTEGWKEQILPTESNSYSKFGKIEGLLNTGASIDISRTVAERVFADKSEPLTTASYELVATDDCVPFQDFMPGDWVNASSDEGNSRRRVMSISLQEDEAGYPLYGVEFDSISKDKLDRLEKWLQTTAQGTLGGEVANSSGFSSSGGGSGGKGSKGEPGPPGNTQFYASTSPPSSQGEFVWFQTDGNGNLVDIFVGKN